MHIILLLLLFVCCIAIVNGNMDGTGWALIRELIAAPDVHIIVLPDLLQWAPIEDLQ